MSTPGVEKCQHVCSPIIHSCVDQLLLPVLTNVHSYVDQCPPVGVQMQRCLATMPALLVLDDLDVVCPATAGEVADPPPGSTAARGTTAWLVGVLDELRGLRLPGMKPLGVCMPRFLLVPSAL